MGLHKETIKRYISYRRDLLEKPYVEGNGFVPIPNTGLEDINAHLAIDMCTNMNTETFKSNYTFQSLEELEQMHKVYPGGNMGIVGNIMYCFSPEENKFIDVGTFK